MPRNRTRSVSMLVAGSLLSARLAVASTEFQVNTHTTFDQRNPAVDAGGGGNFVVVWSSAGQGGDDDDVFARRYDAAGQPLGGEFQVNTYTTSTQRGAAVAADGAGNFTVVWESYTQDGEGFGVFARRFDSAGAPLGGEFQVNTYTTLQQDAPAVTADDAGNLVVVWQRHGKFAGIDFSRGVFGQRYDDTGAAIGSEFQIDALTGDVGRNPAVAADAAGNFVVVWDRRGDQGSYVSGLFGRRYDAGGVPVGGQFVVSSFPGGFPVPAIATDPAGDFTVVWSGGGVFARRYDAAGVPVGAEFQVNTHTTGYRGRSDVAVDAAGGFLVVWHSEDSERAQDGSGFGVFGQRYDATGLPLGGEFQVNAYTTGGQLSPRVAANAMGDFVTVWSSYGQDGSGSGVFGQRNKPDHQIRGKSLRIRGGSGEATRSVSIEGRELSTEIGSAIDGDPTVAGATLRVIAKGAVASDQTYALDASGWRRLGTRGFKYLGPTGADGDPVKRVIFHRTSFDASTPPPGAALLKVAIRGSFGTQSLDVVPPNSGDEGGLILQIGNGGGTYCVSLGGAAGGTEIQDSAARWVVVDATAEAGCPSP